MFNVIRVDESISWQSISIFLSLKYLASDIACIISECQHSKTFTAVFSLSTLLTALINMFERLLTSCSAFNFWVINTGMAPDCEYHTLLNQV